MQSLIHADIFFLVSTVALVLISVGICTALVYAIGILRNVRDMTDKGRAEWDSIVSDSRELRATLRSEGLKWKHVISLVRTFFVRDSEKKAVKAPVKTSKATK
ncbi:MAG TPA: hypothetical protein VHD69_01130 [Candidatus Paceibacterota bacterium]|nr:hypothetical protein [Candidatus Paceibacterota bacterium]